jgi:hypothetical protein
MKHPLFELCWSPLPFGIHRSRDEATIQLTKTTHERESPLPFGIHRSRDSTLQFARQSMRSDPSRS